MSRIQDERFMRRALSLAVRGRGRVSPNPLVGAVIVRGDEVVGEGWHRAVGLPHAEGVALERAGLRARGATAYVTLEPCAHQGRTPPCVEALVAAGIRRCVVATRDPHPVVNGRGLRLLRAAGMRVEVGLLAAEARQVLGGYWLTHTRGRPRVTLKLATSLDGRIAPAGGFARRGASRWLTGPKARRRAHQLRAVADAVVVGSGTARIDDPRLTARVVGSKRQPKRIVCDTRLALPKSLRLLRPPLARGTVVACGPRASRKAEAALLARGVEVWRLPASAEGVSPAALMRRLGREGCHEVLVEGGGALACALLRARVVDRLALFTAPTLLGSGGLSWLGVWRGKRPRGRLIEQARLGDDAYALIELEG
jgi:diaminohydroxyphosphoribosylaminopyrimidine deaminase/5-amino-6-(5-phosphoribosylamino)uracil reductase